MMNLKLVIPWKIPVASIARGLSVPLLPQQEMFMKKLPLSHVYKTIGFLIAYGDVSIFHLEIAEKVEITHGLWKRIRIDILLP
jgi:hypothetical protein